MSDSRSVPFTTLTSFSRLCHSRASLVPRSSSLGFRRTVSTFARDSLRLSSSPSETRFGRETKGTGPNRAPVPVTHILTLSGRSLQSQPFHRESFYVTGTLLAPESRSTFGSAHLASLGVNGMREGAT